MAGTSFDTSVLGRIEQYVRRYAAEHREVERVGPFLATFGLHSNGPYLNYAVPDDGAEPSPGEVEALVRAYERRRLRPRVELVSRLAPSACEVLTAAGFSSEGVFSLMSCGKGAAGAAGVPGGPGGPGTVRWDPFSGSDAFEIVFAHRDDQFRTVLEIRQDAFGEPEPVGSMEISRVRSSVERGGAAVLAVETSSGRAVGSGACLVPNGGITELVSIGVLPRWRRRGVGATITSALARAALMSGSETVYLTAVHDEGERVYERVGFAVNGQLLHLGL